VALGVFGRKHPIVWLLGGLERMLYRRADRIITLLPEAWRYIVGVGGSREKIVWIPNGVSVEDDTGPGAERDEGRPTTVMYAGAHGRANALEDLLKAGEILEGSVPPVRFVLVGEGPKKARLKDTARRLGLRAVEFRSAVPKCEIPSVLQEADVLVALLEDSPLYQYGVSLNKLFDYMAAGKPVILAGRIPHNYVEEARCGLTVPPRDPEALAGAIRELADLPTEDRQEMGRRGRAYVQMYHDWDRLVGEIDGLLEEIVPTQ
jgi:glycosyltransferase involved in cell wall biosynthesis